MTMPPKSTTYQRAKELWSEAGLRLDSAEFCSQFDAIYELAHNASEIDVPALWRLGGAANDYLRKHPQVELDCRDLASILLKANFVDARIIGLKLLNCTGTDLDAIANGISTALESIDEEEICGGLYELGEFLERFAFTDMVNETEISRLFTNLSQLRKSSILEISESARQRMEWIESQS